MKRILACLATLALAAATSAAHAQALARAYDPIGDIIGAVNESALENASDWSLKATLYHGGGGMSTHDSLGCKVSPMRTVAIDRALITRGAILFIKETVGLLLPGGGRHDGYWYASDTGSAIKGQRIDLFTGPAAASMGPLLPLNLKRLTVQKVGQFKGCPPVDGSLTPTRIAKADSASGLRNLAAAVKSVRAERPAWAPVAANQEPPAADADGWLEAERALAPGRVAFHPPNFGQ